MAETKQKAFNAVVSELTKYGFKIEGRPGFELVFSKPEYRKEPFQEPSVGDEVEIIQWSKDKKDAHKIWVSSIRVASFGDVPDDIFGDETELNNSRAKQAPEPPPPGKYPTKEDWAAKDRKIGLLALHKTITPLCWNAGIEKTSDIWDVIEEHEREMNDRLGK